MVVVEDLLVGGRRKRDGSTGGGALQWVGTFWWPPPGASQLADVPATVAEAIAEATRCLLARSPRAAAVMFRGALGHIVSDLGTEAAQLKPNLAQQLRQMAVDGALTPSLAEYGQTPFESSATQVHVQRAGAGDATGGRGTARLATSIVRTCTSSQRA